ILDRARSTPAGRIKRAVDDRRRSRLLQCVRPPPRTFLCSPPLASPHAELRKGRPHPKTALVRRLCIAKKLRNRYLTELARPTSRSVFARGNRVELHEALAQISEIRDQIARTETFEGYRSATVAASGLLAFAAAGLQAALIPDPLANLEMYLTLW